MSDDDEIPHLAAPPNWAIVLAFGVVFLAWGTTYKATSLAMKDEHMPPALFGGVRLILAGVILLSYQLCRGQSLRLRAGEAVRLVLISWFLFLGANFLINFGQKKVDSGIAAILIATTPLWIGLFGMFVPHGERLTWCGWLGLVIGFAGIVLTLAPQLRDGFDVVDVHAMFVLASAASWALGSIVSRQFALKLPHLTSAGFQMLFGGASQVTLGTILGEWEEVPELTPRAIGCFFYVLVFGSLMGFVAFNWLLGHVATAKVGTYAYVNPVIAVAVGWYFDEPLSAWIFAGIAVILIGVWLVRRDHVPVKEIEVEPD
ncbi:MAG TPA: EamA family transporter [Gemmataceae bacterium]|nr:EamA family transporter [Gemmataceae bacterium]